MKTNFNVNESSLEASVKSYHKKVIEPLLPYLSGGNTGELADIIDKLITTDNIKDQSVKYADSAGSIDWSSIKNIPPDLSSSDPNFSTNHTHSNKEILDNISKENIEILVALSEEYVKWKEENPDGDSETFIKQLCNPQSWGTF